MRGKVTATLRDRSCNRITPAYAGKSICKYNCRATARDHPRLCGEKHSIANHLQIIIGSPPPMRGKGFSIIFFTNNSGITPAYAGKSIKLFARLISIQDHPRLCGEKEHLALIPVQLQGSPPPMRGKALQRCAVLGSLRITPAYAGKRITIFWKLLFCQDHPRLCGEKYML